MEIPSPFNNGSYICYAAKSHPAYSSIGGDASDGQSASSSSSTSSSTSGGISANLIFSWVCNVLYSDFELLFAANAMQQGLRAYWPQFMEVQVKIGDEDDEGDTSSGDDSISDGGFDSNDKLELYLITSCSLIVLAGGVYLYRKGQNGHQEKGFLRTEEGEGIHSSLLN